jgi:hypothetical protein
VMFDDLVAAAYTYAVLLVVLLAVIPAMQSA